MHLAESSVSKRLGSHNLPSVRHAPSPLPCTTQLGCCLLVLFKILQPTTHLSRCSNRCFISFDIITHTPKLQHYIPKHKWQLPIVVLAKLWNMMFSKSTFSGVVLKIAHKLQTRKNWKTIHVWVCWVTLLLKSQTETLLLLINFDPFGTLKIQFSQEKTSDLDNTTSYFFPANKKDLRPCPRNYTLIFVTLKTVNNSSLPRPLVLYHVTLMRKVAFDKKVCRLY